MIQSLRKKSLLVVDDNAGAQKMMRRIGESFGYEVYIADARDDAMGLMGRRRFDVAIVDKCLVEHDPNNRDGLVVLEHLQRRDEQTRAYLITGQGEYEDAMEAQTYGAVGSLKKYLDAAKTEAGITAALTSEKAFARPHREIRGPLAFCGSDNAGNWESNATTFLGGGTGPLLQVLNTLAETCEPLLERREDDGLQQVSGHVMAGLYWSRGLGEAVVIVIANDKLPSPLPRAGSWPAELTIDEKPLHSRGKSKLSGAIFRAAGVSPKDFTVVRDVWEE